MSDAPTGWKQVKLGDVARGGMRGIAGGPFGSDLTTADYVDTPGIPVIRGSNLGGEGEFREEEFAFVTEAKAAALSQNVAFPGDLVFTQRGTLGQVAAIPESGRFAKYVVSQSQMKMTVDERLVDKDFVVHYFRSPRARALLEHRTLATGVPHINLGILRDFPFSHPALPDQRRIVNILDEADALRRKRREVLALLDELLPATFLEMFGDPLANSNGWPQVALQDVIASIETGWSASGEERDAGPGELAVLKISAVTSGCFRPSECKVVPAPYPEGLPTPQRGDVLFSRANTRELVAATCIVDVDSPHVFLPDKLWRLKPDSCRATGEWLRFLLADRGFRALLAKRATGSSGSMLNISQAKLLEMTAPVPPLNRQQEFANAVWGVLEQRSLAKAAAAELDALFASLLDRAFTGAL